MKQAKIYDFEPARLADIETEMWRAYYDRLVLRLFRLSIQLLREQLALSPVSSIYNAYRLTMAAFVFKRGKVREDYLKALRWLIPFYRHLHARLEALWQPEAVAESELEWWIIHRHDFGPGNTTKLEKALAELCSAVYHLPTDQTAEFAYHRSQAMLISDAGLRAREKDKSFEPDWKAIYQELNTSYTSLRQQLDWARDTILK